MLLFVYAQSTGVEPATSHVHVIHDFRNGMDYIFTVGFRPLGASVSSLYGAPSLAPNPVDRIDG